METFSAVKEIIERNVNCDAEIKLSDRLVEDLHIDSLDVMLIVNEFEDEFHISIDGKELKEFKTVQDIVNKLDEKIALTI